ncbi:Stress-activated map kinase-interacting protein-like protein [Emericellopsis cladophorae]|uniref:Stress-activated map kinase-interacting protein-like protein n=1 Tax=Emericellopsis cladophorae TaxID=2686198 RepID=A0A9Q0BBD9_9HYPO|nr:Stress-activated map kinase-interacting protein-like protein [Emericellopsis cladophorae]KAI6778400.1 Stress-activated map kinase-interacting protein-like protein [Emericellopsis cladophorae]
MSVIQLDELVAYQLRTSYLNEIADGVGERLLTIDEGFVTSAAFKAAGWRPNSTYHKRTHSPPIPTAVASEYFQAPRHQGLTLEDGEYDGAGMLTSGGADTVGPGVAATKRRRRREQMEEDDSSDLSDESDDDTDHRAAQQIKFAKMPVRNRSGSSPTQTQKQPLTAPSPRSRRRGSQSALDAANGKGRMRRDTVTSSEMSSENELDAVQRRRADSRAALKTVRLQERIQEEEPSPGIKRADTRLLPEEEEDDSDEGSELDYVGSIDSASILDPTEMPIAASPTRQVVGTPPKHLMRQSTIRKSKPPTRPIVMSALPPPRPMSMIRPLSVAPPRSLLSAALKAKEHKSSVPFQKFAHFSGQGTQSSIKVRIYPAFSEDPETAFEVLIRPRVHDGQSAERQVTVADLIGLSLYRYNEERRAPSLAPGKLNINWFTLRMVEEGGEVDDDFPPFERTKPLISFTTVNNANARGGGRMRSNSTAYDEFALVVASNDEFEENQALTPQQEEEEQTSSQSAPETPHAEDAIPNDMTGVVNTTKVLAPARPRHNPITTTFRMNTSTPLADAPAVPAVMNNASRGQQKLLRIHIMSSDTAPGQMVTVDVTTETYLAEVLEAVCRKRQLDKGNHVLKLPGSGAVVMIDRPVSSIGNVSDLELYRRRFATDGPLTMTGSPGSASPKAPGADGMSYQGRKVRKAQQMLGPHPLAREIAKQDELGHANYKKYTVWRKQPMRLVGMSERILVIDGEYIHIVPSSGGKALTDGGGKTTTVHFSNVVGCKVPRKHPTNVKLVVYRATESKRYDFETKGADEADEIVGELMKGISPYRDV